MPSDKHLSSRMQLHLLCFLWKDDSKKSSANSWSDLLYKITYLIFRMLRNPSSIVTKNSRPLFAQCLKRHLGEYERGTLPRGWKSAPRGKNCYFVKMSHLPSKSWTLNNSDLKVNNKLSTKAEHSFLFITYLFLVNSLTSNLKH